MVEAVPEVMFGDEVTGARVETSSKEAGEKQVKESTNAEILHEDVVENELNSNI